ncbi:uncharacterized protein BX664DRAFT_382370 [Halteromyces radiatus]|uniref:uncharacterized protein n=1 Tax=Halteromyces radiatus TaxID=101107 RepID=UPI00221FF541|nr:uncharacterized protein BX664DRAFT_382370 [Halteromyces radiatus]KAI8099902.1 hypothetical protein BX664DRAFT_382370 [Halteromyces radiatus]
MNDKVSEEEMTTLKRAFQLYDQDNDGIINIDEFKIIIMSLNKNLDEATATAIVKEVDKNNDCVIDFDEFVCAMIRLSPYSTTSSGLKHHDLQKWNPWSHFINNKYEEDELIECFRAFDTNHDGLISRTELDKVMRKLGEQLSQKDLEDMINEADTNKDGYIDYEEFKRLLA